VLFQKVLYTKHLGCIIVVVGFFLVGHIGVCFFRNFLLESQWPLSLGRFRKTDDR
jgi:hypothetical protein